MPTTGAINIFFRQQWEALRLFLGMVPTVGNGFDATNQGAAITSQLVYTVVTAGVYRVSYYLRKTFADGAGSSTQFSWNWTESAGPQSLADAANATDTTGAVSANEKVLKCDANSQITASVAYASTTPGRMRFLIGVRVEQLN